MKICAIIPSYNHYTRIADIIERLKREKLPVFIIDDGSDEPARSALALLHDESHNVIIQRFNTNQGKGAAVLEGFQLAFDRDFTHAVQIDADNQHDLDALLRLLELATANPEALISGEPIYDESIPKSRKIGRWVTHVWVWIETLSLRITDSMCGFRVYPLAAVKRLLAEESVGHRMQFDTDIMVRLFWRGVPPIMVPVKVTYPPDNTSNFDLWRDNWCISMMHTRLFLTMLFRLPGILAHRPPNLNPQHWANIHERGTYWGLRFCITAYRLLGPTGCQIVMTPIVLYFYLMGSPQRMASRQFLTRALKREPTFLEGYNHYMNFAMRMLDTLNAWAGEFPADRIQSTDPAELTRIEHDPRGGLFIVAHLGNTDVAHAVLDKKTQDRITILAHTSHAQNYNRMLQKLHPGTAANILQVTEIGPETIIDLKQRVERGEWIVIAGDRIPVLNKENSVAVPFLGNKASFPQGPWILGALLECPVYLLFCLKDGPSYHLTMEQFAERLDIPRNTREESLKAYVAKYAERLEHYTLMAPLQWYNFYDFWAPV